MMATTNDDPGDEAVVGSAERQIALFVKELKTFETVSCDLRLLKIMSSTSRSKL